MATGNNNNGFHRPPQPPPERPLLVPPYVNSVYNVITRRLRKANTIFADRVKLVLTQESTEHWSRLNRPYLLVVPQQVRQPRQLEVDYMAFVNPRVVTFVAQFDDRNSEKSHLAANDIDTAERQLIFVLAKWQPAINYKPTEYGGMRIQATRSDAVKVSYQFVFNEQIALPDEPPEIDAEELQELTLDNINIRVVDPCCPPPLPPCECEPEPFPQINITGGGCPSPKQPDPCAPPPCPSPLGPGWEKLGESDAASKTKKG